MRNDGVEAAVGCCLSDDLRGVSGTPYPAVLLTERNSASFYRFAEVTHVSTPDLTQSGTGTVRHVTFLADEISQNPVVFSKLKVFDFNAYHFSSMQTAADQHGEDRPITDFAKL